MNANRRCKYKLLLRGGIGELCQKIGLVQLLNTCWDYDRILFDVICEVVRLILRQFYEDWTNCILCMYKMTWLKCILWGTRFPPTLCW